MVVVVVIVVVVVVVVEVVVVVVVVVLKQPFTWNEARAAEDVLSGRWTLCGLWPAR